MLGLFCELPVQLEPTPSLTPEEKVTIRKVFQLINYFYTIKRKLPPTIRELKKIDVRTGELNKLYEKGVMTKKDWILKNESATNGQNIAFVYFTPKGMSFLKDTYHINIGEENVEN